MHLDPEPFSHESDPEYFGHDMNHTVKLNSYEPWVMQMNFYVEYFRWR
jgi:hypothetical protein